MSDKNTRPADARARAQQARAGAGYMTHRTRRSSARAQRAEPVSAQRRAAQQHAHTVRAAPGQVFAQRARRGDDSRSTTCRRRRHRRRRRRRRRPSAGAGSRGRCVLQEHAAECVIPSLQRDFSAEPQVHGAAGARGRWRGHVVCEVIGEDGGQSAAARGGRGWVGAGSRIGASRSPSSRRESGAGKYQGKRRGRGWGACPSLRSCSTRGPPCYARSRS